MTNRFNVPKLVIKSHKVASIDVEKPLINAQSIKHNFVAKAANKILEAAFIMPVFIVRVLTACD